MLLSFTFLHPLALLISVLFAFTPVHGRAIERRQSPKWSPYGIKAGITGEAGLEYLGPYISSYNNWQPSTYSSIHPNYTLFMPMLWGTGHTSATDAARVQLFKSLYSRNASTTAPAPKVVIGFNEPDCAAGNGSSGVPVAQAATLWNQLISPLKAAGSLLVSPSMCKQFNENWLTPFSSLINVTWDITNVHIGQNNVTRVQQEIDYFWNKYKRPIYVTEFVCTATKPAWKPCTNQTEINQFIKDIVAYFESDPRVLVYQFSQGQGLPQQWRLTQNNSHALTETGQVYKAAIQSYAAKRKTTLGF